MNNRFCAFGDTQTTTDVTHDLHLHVLSLSGFAEAVNIFTSESYAGSMVGNGFVWRDEVPFASLLATARLLLIDYEMGLETSP